MASPGPVAGRVLSIRAAAPNNPGSGRRGRLTDARYVMTSGDSMATLAELEERKRELEARLAAGDLTAEAALARLDGAISARSRQIQHSRKRLAVARDAVQAGMAPDEARKRRTGPGAAKKKPAGPINRF